MERKIIYMLCLFLTFCVRLNSKEYEIKEMISLDSLKLCKGGYGPIGDFHCNRARVDVCGEKSNVFLRGYINKNGDWVVFPYYSYYDPHKNISQKFDGDFHDGMAVVCDTNAQFFYVDTLGKKLMDQRINWMLDFEDGYATVSISNKGVYYINTKGECQNRLNFGMSRYKNIFSYKKKGKYGFKRFDGTIITKAQYDSLDFCGCGYIKVWENGHMSVIDTLFNPIHDIKKIEICDEIINKSLESKCYLDFEGNPISRNYDILYPFSDGLGCVRKKDGKYAYLDRKGTEVISFGNDTICYSFNNGYARIKVLEKYGLIDKEKKIILSVKYDYIGKSYEDGIVCVCEDDRYKYLLINVLSH